MRSAVFIASLVLIVSPVAFGQGHAGQGGAAARAGGFAGAPRTGGPVLVPPPVVPGPTFGTMPSSTGSVFGTMPSSSGLPSLGALPSLGPLPPAGGTPPGRAPGRGRGRGYGYGGAVIYPAPVYGGYGYGPGWMPEPGTYDPIFGVYSPYPGEGYASAAPPQTPSVVINQNFAPEAAHPVLRDYTTTPLPQPGQQPDQTQQQPEGRQNGTQAGTANAAGVYDQPLFLIAMKDHTIYPALAYWVDVDKGVLNYITVQGTPNQVSLSLVDRDLSKRLNDERGMTFRLPLAK